MALFENILKEGFSDSTGEPANLDILLITVHNLKLSNLHAPLLAWFDANQRDLPWRRTKDPYAIWVSEIMLQQTQVATVVPYFERWMARFPSVQVLATASEDEVLSLWQGLGYYRRARQLLTGSRTIIQGSGTPKSAAEWQKVPGIGPYTAGAIASIALNEAVPLVDGNVERVYARLENDSTSGPLLNRAAWKWATENVHQERPGDWNQALMELGATICKPIDPKCMECPVYAHCKAFQAGTQTKVPTMVKKEKPKALTRYVWIPICNGKLGIRQIPDNQWWAGMWEFPREVSLDLLESQFPNAWPVSLGSFRHTVTNHRIQVHVSLVQLEAESGQLRWVTRKELSTIALPAPQRRALGLAESHL